MTQTTDITARVKTLEDALAITGRPAVPEFADVPEELRSYLQAQYKAMAITETLNEKWVANWSNWDENKWFPWFDYDKASSRFAFYATSYLYAFATAGYASRLCFRTKALAEYAGRQFEDIYNELLLK